jgi:hypothetical protein
MKNKYYTPTIEEFHVGFEYEFYYKSEWHKHNLDGTPIVHHELDEFSDDLMKLAHAICRVKHLDQSDIESFGFSLRHEFAFWFRGGTYVLITSNHGVISILSNKTEVEKVVFVGKIKNKSELGVILKQIGVI